MSGAWQPISTEYVQAAQDTVASGSAPATGVRANAAAVNAASRKVAAHSACQ